MKGENELQEMRESYSSHQSLGSIKIPIAPRGKNFDTS